MSEMTQDAGTETESPVPVDVEDAEPVWQATDDDKFGIQMVSPWGEVFTWADVDAETAQEIFKMLGSHSPPPEGYRVNIGPGDARLAGAPGGELGAE